MIFLSIDDKHIFAVYFLFKVFGSNKAKGGLSQKTKDQLVNDLLAIHTIENWLRPLTETEIEARKTQWGRPRLTSTISEVTSFNEAQEDPFKGYPVSLEHYLDEEFKRSIQSYNQEKMSFYDHCRECNSFHMEPKPQELLIYLHCYRYKADGWEYTASWPNWAKEDWKLD